jgi:hypothetical protein
MLFITFNHQCVLHNCTLVLYEIDGHCMISAVGKLSSCSQYCCLCDTRLCSAPRHCEGSTVTFTDFISIWWLCLGKKHVFFMNMNMSAKTIFYCTLCTGKGPLHFRSASTSPKVHSQNLFTANFTYAEFLSGVNPHAIKPPKIWA